MKNKKTVFIPFIDGLLNYDCSECNNMCCFGSGFLMINARQKKKLLQKHPFLKYFIVKGTRKTYWLKRHSKCWFLGKDRLCNLQKKYGYSAKPSNCRLHPFYVAGCAGKYVALLDACSGLCVEKGGKNVSHQRILKEVQEAIDNDFISEEIPWSRSRLALEKKILAGSKLFLDRSNYLDFAAYQMSLTTKEETPKLKQKMLETIELWKSFFKIGKLNLENKKLTRELVALTSVLRLGNYSSAALRRLEAEEIPPVLLALYFYLNLFLKDIKTKVYMETCRGVLNDIGLTLPRLNKEDLKLRNKSVEDKLKYLHLLQKLQQRKQFSTAGKK